MGGQWRIRTNAELKRIFDNEDVLKPSLKKGRLRYREIFQTLAAKRTRKNSLMVDGPGKEDLRRMRVRRWQARDRD